TARFTKARRWIKSGPRSASSRSNTGGIASRSRTDNRGAARTPQDIVARHKRSRHRGKNRVLWLNVLFSAAARCELSCPSTEDDMTCLSIDSTRLHSHWLRYRHVEDSPLPSGKFPRQDIDGVLRTRSPTLDIRPRCSAPMPSSENSYFY